jgi:hypothetical protein
MWTVKYCWNITDKETLKFLEKILPTATFSTINLTWIGLELKPVLRDMIQAANSPNHGTTVKNKFNLFIFRYSVPTAQ